MSLHRALVALLVGSAAAFSLKGAARLTSSLRAPMGLLTMAEDEVPPADAPEAQTPPPPAVTDPPPVVPQAAAAGPLASDIWTSSSSVKVQGSTLKTWDIGEEATQRVQLSLRSSGRPIDANVELWHTPSYIPTKFRIYTENGESRPVDAIIETPKHPQHGHSAPPLPAPEHGSCASSARAWRLWAARHSQGGSRPLGPQPPPRGLRLERAASKVADSSAF